MARFDLPSKLTCKPIDWDAIKPVQNQTALKMVRDLPMAVVQANVLYATDPQVWKDFVVLAPAQVFVMARGRSRYLVDTQGFNYARYIGRLEDAQT